MNRLGNDLRHLWESTLPTSTNHSHVIPSMLISFLTNTPNPIRAQLYLNTQSSPLIGPWNITLHFVSCTSFPSCGHIIENFGASCSGCEPVQCNELVRFWPFEYKKWSIWKAANVQNVLQCMTQLFDYNFYILCWDTATLLQRERVLQRQREREERTLKSEWN